MKHIKNFKPQAIIFDKDGTLIDFHAMWGNWVVYLAQQLSQASQINVHEVIYQAMGYDVATQKVLATGKVAMRPMAELFQLTIETLQSLNIHNAQQLVAHHWVVPDPVLLAKPLTDLDLLFSKLHQHEIKIAIATADDRAPTLATLQAFDVEDYISTFICADDNIASKPDPSMVLELCQRLNLKPADVIVIGDTIADLKMGRAAGAGLCIGVLSGVSNHKDLLPYADVILESIEELHIYLEEAYEQSSSKTESGLNPDFAF